ncbi:MAG: hypothetical protein F6K28_04235 [Microcoleus sp. SIO2G3]|nr:hypothetical protein [Microcoleus sp. SIO2G3]
MDNGHLLQVGEPFRQFLNGTAVASTGGTPATHCLGNPRTGLAHHSSVLQMDTDN